MSPVRRVSSGDTALLAPVVSSGPSASVVNLVQIGSANQWHVVDKRLLVGRGEASARPGVVRIDDHAMSREHAEFSPDRDGVRVRDLGSLNGTFVDGERATDVRVEQSAVIRMGESVFILRRSTEAASESSPGGPLVGGPSLSAVRRKIGLVGPTDLAVLVTGETGTGKDVAARAIHEASRRPGPFVAVNCAALPGALIESELFGHTRGAFTGATKARQGLFAAAHEGTLFLDEVGDLPLVAQAKLLRVIEDGEIRAVGSEVSRAVSVRIVSATNSHLQARTDEGSFRADLWARLAPVTIHMPPLRQRIEDVPALCEHLLQRANAGHLRILPDALEPLLLHDWPMNVRELDSVLRNAALAATDGIARIHLPAAIREQGTARTRSSESSQTDRPFLLQGPKEREASLDRALRTHQGNVRKTAKMLGIARSHLYRLIERHEIGVDEYRTASD